MLTTVDSSFKFLFTSGTFSLMNWRWASDKLLLVKSVKPSGLSPCDERAYLDLCS